MAAPTSASPSPDAAETRQSSRAIQLPSLRGSWLIAYRVIWCLAAVLASITLAFGFGAEVQDQRVNRAIYGLGLEPDALNASGIPVRPLSSEAKQALGGPATLAGIGGRPVRPDRREIASALAGAEGARIELDLIRGDGSRDRVSLRRGQHTLEAIERSSGLSYGLLRWIGYGVSLLVYLLWVTTGLLLFMRRSRDPVAAMIAVSAVLFAGDLQSVWPTAPVAQALGFLPNYLFILALITFPDGRFYPRWTIGLAVLFFVNMSASLTGQLTGAVGAISFSVTILSLIALLVAITIRYRSLGAGVQRQQIKVAVFGIIVGILMFLASFGLQMALAATESEATRPWLALGQAITVGLGNIIMAAGLLVSLLRYRLYDAEATISRSAAYGVLTVSLLAIFAASEKLVETLGEEYFGASLGALASGIGAALAAIMLVPLHHRLTHWAEHRFQKQLIDLKRRLPLLVGDLRETASLERMAAMTLENVAHGVRARRAALLVGDAIAGAWSTTQAEVNAWRGGWTEGGHEGLQCDRSDSHFPVRMPLSADGHGHVGWLLLGPRIDGSFYGKDEREALAEISSPIARAVEIVRLREHREAVTENMLMVLSSKVEAMEAVLSQLQIKLAGPAEA